MTLKVPVILVHLTTAYDMFIIFNSLIKSSKLMVTSYCYYFQGSSSLKSLKESFKDSGFISRRHFWNIQAFSAAVIYNDTVYTQLPLANSTGNQTQR